MRIFLKILFTIFLLITFLFSPLVSFAQVIEDANYDYFYMIDLDLGSISESQGFSITWKTTQPMTTEIEYGETPSMGTVNSGDQSLTAAHSMIVENLKQKTTYWYRPRGKDSSGQLRAAPAISFQTNPDYNPPKIANLKVVPKAASAIISWTTSEPTACTVSYGQSISYGKNIASSFKTSHSITLKDLMSSTTYHYSVNCYDQSGNATQTQGDSVFTTTTGSLTVSSSSHPNQESWYNSGKVVLSWPKPQDAISFEYLLSQKSDGGGSWVEELTTSKTFDNLDDGVWYFRIKAKNIGGYSDESLFKLQVDKTPPEVFTPTATDSGKLYGPLEITFSTTDKTSGIEKFQINIDDQDFIDAISPYLVDYWQIKSGDHAIKIKAIDKANNETVGVVDINVPIPPSPTISLKDAPDGNLNYKEPVIFSGEALANSVVSVSLARKEYKAEVDSTGRWQSEIPKVLNPGKYKVSAVVIAGVNKSQATPIISFKINGPWWIGKEIYLILSILLVIVGVIVYKFYYLKLKGLVKIEQEPLDEFLVGEVPKSPEKLQEGSS